jgi:hypothetical protein
MKCKHRSHAIHWRVFGTRVGLRQTLGCMKCFAVWSTSGRYARTIQRGTTEEHDQISGGGARPVGNGASTFGDYGGPLPEDDALKGDE